MPRSKGFLIAQEFTDVETAKATAGVVTRLSLAFVYERRLAHPSPVREMNHYWASGIDSEYNEPIQESK